ncbi:MAG TPA: hypothetical protein VFB84_17055, partial [Micromonosporaceae bacterium]|nr:hypothetical protein [Micromonosporaceae bacterium]
THDEARALLVARLGADRVAVEPGAIEELITLCARLPLALAIVAARAAAQRGLRLATLSEQLRGLRDRLDALDIGDKSIDVRAVLSWSYRALSVDVARLFRLLGAHPGPDISVSAAASLAGVLAETARAGLDELVRANLLTEPSPGRFAFHDLLRAYAGELADAGDPVEQRDAAVQRMRSHYLQTADAADNCSTPTARSSISPTRHPGRSSTSSPTPVRHSTGSPSSGRCWSPWPGKQ